MTTRHGLVGNLLDAMSAGRPYASRAGVGQFTADAAHRAKLAEADLAGAELQGELRALLEHLPQGQRDVLKCRLAGLNGKRTAVALGITPQTASRRLAVALKTMRALLQPAPWRAERKRGG